MTAEETGFLRAIKQNPADATARGAYADWLDEHDRPYEALLQRDRAGISEAWFKLRRKSDGLFSEGLTPSRREIRWSTKGKMWRKLSDLRSHLVNLRNHNHYGSGTDWDDLEVIVIEVRAAVTVTLPVVVTESRRVYGTFRTLSITEPPGADAEPQ
jgi:uncharacterized protein (TIGR02996 family)